MILERKLFSQNRAAARKQVFIKNCFLIVLPILSLFIFVSQFGSNIIMTDNWDFVTHARQLSDASLSFGDLHHQYSLHRPFFPRLYLAVAYRLTDYDQKLVLLLSLWTFILGYFLIYKKVSGSENFSQNGIPLWFWPLPFLVLSWAQVQNLLWCVVYPFTTLFALVSFFLLDYVAGRSAGSSRLKLYAALAGAVLASIVSAFSISNGLLVGVFGCAFIFAIRDKEVRWRSAVVWAVSLLAIWLFFFHNYRLPPSESQTSIASILSLAGAMDCLRFIATYLGGILNSSTLSAGLGAIQLSAFGLVLYSGIKRRTIREDLFWLAICFFILASAFMTFVGRGPYGNDFALESRYVTGSALFIVANVVLFVRWLAARKSESWRSGRLKPKVVLSGVAAALALLVVATSVKTCNYARQLHLAIDDLIPIARNFDRESDENLKRIYYNPVLLRSHLSYLREHKLAIFSDSAHLLGQPLISAAKLYRLGDQLLFTRKGNATGYTRSGWNRPEEGFTWIDGCSASVVLNLGSALPMEGTLKIKALCYPCINDKEAQLAEIFVNGNKLAVWQFTEPTQVLRECEFPGQIVTNGTMQIDIHVPTARQGATAAQRKRDPRVLGVAFVTLQILQDPD